MLDDDDDMLEEFRVEAEEMFEESEDGLLRLEDGQDFKLHYNKIFRAFHSLKGAAGMFGLEVLQEHMHKMENFFESKKDDDSISPMQVDYFLKGVDAAKKILESGSADFQHVSKEEFDALQTGGAAPAAPAEEAAPVAPEEVVVETPVEEAPVEEVVEAAPSVEIPSEGEIFVIASDPILLNKIVEFGNEGNYTVYSFESEQQLLDHVELNERPIAIFVGINLQGIQDDSLLAGLKEVDPGLSIVILDNKDDKHELVEVLNKGAFNVLDSYSNFDAFAMIMKDAKRKVFAEKLLDKTLNFVIQQYNDFSKVIKTLESNPLGENFQKEFDQILTDKKNFKDLK